MRRTVPSGVTVMLLPVLLVTTLPVRAASVSLREGLHAEEAEGDLDAAIKIYQQVIDDQTAPKNIVAQALCRQGMRYLKENELAAKTAFASLLANYGDQIDLIEKVKPLLERLGNADPVALMPPETIAHIETDSPGKQGEIILRTLEEPSFENPLVMIGGNQRQSQPFIPREKAIVPGPG